MSAYQAPLKDMKFVLKELAGLEQVAKLPGYQDATPDTVDAILEEARDVLVDALKKVLRPEPSYGFLVGKIREVLSGFIYERIRRRPMILSVVTEV